MTNFVDSNGKKRDRWWNSSDEQVMGNVTEQEFEQSRRDFSKMLEEKRKKQEAAWHKEFIKIRAKRDKKQNAK